MTEREELEDVLEQLEQHKVWIAELRHEIAHQHMQVKELVSRMQQGEAPIIEPWQGKGNSLGAKNGTISDLPTGN